MRRNVTAALLAAAALSACGGGDEGPAAGGCHMVALGTCSVYLSGAPVFYSPSSCSAIGGVWVDACPAEGRLGTCVFSGEFPESMPLYSSSTFTASETWYPGILATPAEAADWCASVQGEFTAGTGHAGPAVEQAFSCDRRATEATCSDFSGLWEPERRTAFEFACTMNGGAVLPAGTACPAEGRTGTCRWTHELGLRYEDERHYRATTAEEAGCYSWTPG